MILSWWIKGSKIPRINSKWLIFSFLCYILGFIIGSLINKCENPTDTATINNSMIEFIEPQIPYSLGHNLCDKFVEGGYDFSSEYCAKYNINITDTCCNIDLYGSSSVSAILLGTDNRAAFSHSDLAHLQLVLKEYPNLCNITELGTAGGATSLFLGMISRMRNIDGNCKLITFDIGQWGRKIDNEEEKKNILYMLGDEIQRGWLHDNMIQIHTDVLTQKNKMVINAIKRPNSFVFFDNGDKQKEINMYAKYMNKGDVFMTHDWGAEIHRYQIQNTLKHYNFTDIYPNFARSLAARTRAFVRL